MFVLKKWYLTAINPSKQLGAARNSQRRADVNTILNAVYQYSIDNGGNFPATISQANCVNVGTNEIATSSATTTAASIDLYSKLVGTSVSSSTYLVPIPRDPLATTTGGAAGTGYVIVKTTGNRITVCAPLAENATTISATR